MYYCTYYTQLYLYADQFSVMIFKLYHSAIKLNKIDPNTYIFFILHFEFTLLFNCLLKTQLGRLTTYLKKHARLLLLDYLAVRSILLTHNHTCTWLTSFHKTKFLLVAGVFFWMSSYF